MAISGITDFITNSTIYKGASTAAREIKQGALDLIPEAVYSDKKMVNGIKKTGEKISSAEQRLILGASALMSQPFIDANNKRVDEKTRKVSVARTIAKIVAGTFTGYFIRKGCIKGIKALSQVEGKNVSKWKSIFTPKNIKDNTTDAFLQYRNAMGTVVALVVMMFTNFLIDAPLTKFLTNKFVDKIHNNASKPQNPQPAKMATETKEVKHD